MLQDSGDTVLEDDEPEPLSDDPLLDDLLSEPTGAVAGSVHGWTGHSSRSQAVTVCMAGVAGVRVDSDDAGKFTRWAIERGASSDWRQARQIVPYLTRKEQAEYFNRRLRKAWRIIVRLKDVHAAMVEALLQKGKLTYPECVEIWQNSLHSPAPVKRNPV